MSILSTVAVQQQALFSLFPVGSHNNAKFQADSCLCRSKSVAIAELTQYERI